jgi:hypothetical protein
MDCKHFRDNHFAFVDDTLPGIELVGMQMHLNECESCAKHDATIRRSLMLFRSLPTIQPSSDFSTRLEEKLRKARLADAAADQAGRSRTFAAAIALTSVAMLGYIGVSLRTVDTPRDIVFPPVVAIAPASAPVPVEIASPAPEMLVAASAGLPLWTAALLAEQSPVHFASLEMASVSR